LKEALAEFRSIPQFSQLLAWFEENYMANIQPWRGGVEPEKWIFSSGQRQGQIDVLNYLRGNHD